MILTTSAVLSTVLLLASGSPQQYNRPRPFGGPAPVPAAAAPVPVSGPGPQLAARSGANPDALARTLKEQNDNGYDGNFIFGFETENGISQQASGTLKNPGTDQEAIVVQGSYSYTSPEGQVITITYIADEEGFKAQGDAIPTPPPVPEAIARAVEYLRSLPPDPSQKLQ